MCQSSVIAILVVASISLSGCGPSLKKQRADLLAEKDRCEAEAARLDKLAAGVKPRLVAVKAEYTAVDRGWREQVAAAHPELPPKDLENLLDMIAWGAAGIVDSVRRDEGKFVSYMEARRNSWNGSLRLTVYASAATTYDFRIYFRALQELDAVFSRETDIESEMNEYKSAAEMQRYKAREAERRLATLPQD